MAVAFALAASALAVLHAPVGFGLAWWVPAALAGLAAAGFGALAVRLPGRLPGYTAAALAAGLAGYAIATSVSRPIPAAIVLSGLVVAGAALAWLATRGAGPAARATGARCRGRRRGAHADDRDGPSWRSPTSPWR